MLKNIQEWFKTQWEDNASSDQVNSIYPSPLKLQCCWLLSLTPIT
jgi:hypothetical protein